MKFPILRRVALLTATFGIFISPAMAGITVNGFGPYFGIEGAPVQILNTISYSNSSNIDFGVPYQQGSSWGYTKSSTFGLDATALLNFGNGSTQTYSLPNLGGTSISDLSSFSIAPLATNNQGGVSIGKSVVFEVGTNPISETISIATETITTIYTLCTGNGFYNGVSLIDCMNANITTTRTFSNESLTFYSLVEVGDPAPVITGYTSQIFALQGQAFNYSVTASDFGPLTYSWDLNGDGVFGDATSASGSFSFDVPGTHEIVVRVADEGRTIVQGMVVEVAPSPGAVQTVPEPSSPALVLAGLGVALIATTRRRRISRATVG